MTEQYVLPRLVAQALHLPRADAVPALRWLAEARHVQPSVRIAARIALKHLAPQPPRPPAPVVVEDAP